jgi:acyl-CoA reductase-like NAD-dependent aldehyde dehydrogenase
LKLGGKDPAYVRQDADLAYTAAELVDGEKHSIVSLAAASSVFQGHSSTPARVAARLRWGLSGFNSP